MIKYFFLLLIVINKTINYIFEFPIFILSNQNLEKNINPIILIEDSYPFILSSDDEDYYYIICSENNLKINKESGTIENKNNNDLNLIIIYIFQINIIILIILHLFLLMKFK